MPTRETPTHSPAPWSIDRRDLVGQDTLHDAQGNYLAMLDSTSAADDRLILKAPELLDACRRWLRRCESGSVLFYSANYAEIKALVDHIDGDGE